MKKPPRAADFSKPAPAPAIHVITVSERGQTLTLAVSEAKNGIVEIVATLSRDAIPLTLAT